MATSNPDPATKPAANQRQCYCGSLDAAFLREQKIPEGFCGICERCGQPGHTQHFPGPVPYTGAWCDRCVRIVALTWPLRSPKVWLGIILVVVFVVSYLRHRH
jgi:hypothetical protein